MVQYFDSNLKAAPIQLILPTLYSFFSKLYAIYGLGSSDEKRIASEVGIPPFLVKNYLASARQYSYPKVEQILLTIQAYNLSVIGIHNAPLTDGELMKELVVKIMDDFSK
jgi:DNA polymerase-3 subunit delta